MSSIYQINKGINKSIEFKGLRAQYIGYLAGGLLVLLLGFIILYVAHVNIYVCMIAVFGSGTFLVMRVFQLSHKYGQYGLMKRRAKAQVPGYLKFRSRKLFTQLMKGL